MEQLRKALAWLKSYHFWVLSVVVVIIGAACWYLSAKALAKQYQVDQQEIKSAFDRRDAIGNKAFHPNPDIIEKQLAEVQKRSKSVIDTWDKLYNRQRAEVLKWPPELGKDFCDEMEKLKFGDDISRNRRILYQNYVEAHFPVLPKKIQAREMAANAGGGRGGFMREPAVEARPAPLGERGGRGDPSGRTVPEPVEEDFVCEWFDQQSVRDELHFEQMPSPLLMWCTQENLWAYHTLLDVIKATNGDADRKSNAMVKEIISLQVGRPAAQMSRTGDRISLEDSVRAGAVAAADASGGRGGGGGEPGGRDDRSQAESPEQEAARLLSGRYVDGDGKPKPFSGAVSVSAIRAAFGTEYKRLPVRLNLMMDWKALPQLITQCANQPLQVEVQEVRINPADRGASGFMSSGGRDMGNQQAFGTGAALTFSPNEDLVQVVIQGVIYIFNEPDKSIMPVADGAAAN